MNSISSSSAFEILPQDVQTLIFEEFLPDDSPIHSVNVAYRNAYLKKLTFETEKKIGLYGKSIILEGILCKRKIDELSDELNKEAIRNEEKLNSLSIFILKLRHYKNIEKTIYNLCGGKKKYHELKILPWEDSMKHLFGLMKIEKIKLGESIMRGRDPNDNPFIAMHAYLKKDFHLFGYRHETSKIIVFHQSTFDNRWNILEILPRHINQHNVSIESNKIRGNLTKKICTLF